MAYTTGNLNKKAIYTLKFKHDGEKWTLLETCTGGELPDVLDLEKFGRDLAQSKLIDLGEKQRFKEMFRAYINYMDNNY